MYVGIEAGGTKFVCAAGTGPDDLVDVTTFPTTTPDETLGRARAFVADHTDGLRGIGVASFGPVELRRASGAYGSITSTPKAGWTDIDVVGPLRAVADVPIGFDTDVNGAALGEARWGAASDVESCVYVTVGTGIGGGGMVSGQLLHGLLHPEMGHLHVTRHPDDEFAGRCPFHGDCLEGMAAGPAIEERWGRPGQDLTGDQLSQAVAMEAEYLAQLAAAMTYILSPERLVFGGGVLHLEGLVDSLRARLVGRLNGYLAVPEITDHAERYVVLPALGDHAGVLGAIALADRAASHGA
ncbi:MAG: ROK family protein [Actinobacteria bacterium]|nr:ROK family protein [Actinomycetota bacterium]